MMVQKLECAQFPKSKIYNYLLSNYETELWVPAEVMAAGAPFIRMVLAGNAQVSKQGGVYVPPRALSS